MPDNRYLSRKREGVKSEGEIEIGTVINILEKSLLQVCLKGWPVKIKKGSES
jgi:hypothetical protein